MLGLKLIIYVSKRGHWWTPASCMHPLISSFLSQHFDVIMTLLLRRVSAGIVCLLFAYILFVRVITTECPYFVFYKSLLRHMKKSTNHKNNLWAMLLTIVGATSYHQWAMTQWLSKWYYFYPRPALAFGYSRCLCLCVRVCLSVCLCVCQSLVHAVTRDPFKRGSLNLNKRCKRSWLRSILFLGAIDLDHRSNLTWKSKFTPFWACQHHNSSPVQARTTKFGPGVKNIRLKPITCWLASRLLSLEARHHVIGLAFQSIFMLRVGLSSCFR